MIPKWCEDLEEEVPELRRKLASAEAREAKLREALEEAIECNGHRMSCASIKSIAAPTFIVESECNCWLAKARAALATVKDGNPVLPSWRRTGTNPEMMRDIPQPP